MMRYSISIDVSDLSKFDVSDERKIDSELYKAFENYHKRYLVHKVDNYEIYAMSWDDVFQDFKLKNQYILSKLNFDNE